MKFLLVSALTISFAEATLTDLRNGLRRAQASSSSCSSDCTQTQFCGNDGQCYEYSCESWLRFGDWTKLGGVDVSAASLNCEDYINGKEDNYHAVVYACQGYGPGTEIEAGEGFSQVFNRKCSADLGEQTFECYYLEQDTDFSYFLSQVEASDLGSSTCSQYSEEDIAAGAPTNPSYIYEVVLEEKSVTEFGTNSSVTFVGPNWTSTLDTSIALATMYASVSVKTPEPTPSPTSTGATPAIPTVDDGDSTSGTLPFFHLTTPAVAIASVGMLFFL